MSFSSPTQIHICVFERYQDILVVVVVEVVVVVAYIKKIKIQKRPKTIINYEREEERNIDS